LSDSKLDEYLQQGIYGPKETNPDERRKFLGTIRERIEWVLTSSQVMEGETYKEVEQAMKNLSGLQLLLNGRIDYRFLSKYIKVANKAAIPYTIVKNAEHETDIGLVLTHKDAINKEDIYITRKPTVPDQMEQPKKKGIFSIFKKLI
jgi:uncharacterized protein YueI